MMGLVEELAFDQNKQPRNHANKLQMSVVVIYLLSLLYSIVWYKCTILNPFPSLTSCDIRNSLLLSPGTHV